MMSIIKNNFLKRNKKYNIPNFKVGDKVRILGIHYKLGPLESLSSFISKVGSITRITEKSVEVNFFPGIDKIFLKEYVEIVINDCPEYLKQ